MTLDIGVVGIASDKAGGRRRLPHGDAMTCTEANVVTRARETSLVVVAGSPDSGKTTLLASLLHCFQRGPFGGFCFAGSETLVGFDKRCHSGRTRSRLPFPDTPRTKLGEPKRILHLRLSDEQSRLRDVLFTDISGEEYEELRHSVDACRDFELFSRADYTVLLVDGERLANAGERHAAKIEVLQMLRCMHDAGRLTQHTWLDVLVAKCDLLTTEQAKNFADTLLTEISSLYSSKVATLRRENIAARPEIESEEFPLGHGVANLLPAWTTRRVESVDLRVRSRSENSMSEFDRFLQRQSPTLVVE